MNDSITDLGESLASVYRNKMVQWSALEFTFSADDLSASFGLADDILRLEEGWQTFPALVQTLQTDFLPQDLIAVSRATALLPEEQPLPPRFVRRPEDYPFTLPAETVFTGVPIDFPAGAARQPAENQAADSANLPAADRAADFPEAKRTSSPHTKRGDLSFGFFENLVQAPDDIPAPPDAKILKTLRDDVSDPVRNQGLPSLDKLSIPVAENSPQTPAQETPDLPETSSDSIWTRPLRNLGDFTTRITYPVTEKGGNVKLPDPPENAITGADAGSIERAQPGVESVKLPVSFPRSSSLDPDFEMAPLPERPEYFPPSVQASGSKAETQSFEQETNRNVPDTDDLLDALTDRILRDFRRYYP